MHSLVRRSLFTAAAAGLLLVATAPGASAQSAAYDILHWSDCPPGAPYAFTTYDPTQFAHFQNSPVAGPSGGACSLEVVSGHVVVPAASSTGGVVFPTTGEVAGEPYTLEYDMQFVSGTDPWIFTNENGSGDYNGIFFGVNYPGDNCWYHVKFTAPLGAAGPKDGLYVYQASPGPEEIRLDNALLYIDKQSKPGLTMTRNPKCTCQ